MGGEDEQEVREEGRGCWGTMRILSTALVVAL